MYLRIFKTNPGSWYTNEMSFGMLLKHFDAEAKKRPPPASVFKVDTEAEELRSAAAFFQTSLPGRVEQRFGVCLKQEDCDRAGIGIDAGAVGDTGIKDVDQRHVNLTGSQKQFSEMIVQILARLWEGENRLRVFPAWQILGELAVLAHLPKGQIEEGARANCQRVLDKHAGMVNYLNDRSSVELKKELTHNHLKLCVVAVRSF